MKTTSVENLNKVLANLQVVYQNFRSLHWLVKGSDFFMLHNKYEEMYNETAEVVDEVAERILTLGGTPLHQFSDYVSYSNIAPVSEVPKGKASLQIAVDNYNALLNNYREIISEAAENGDEGTVALFSELIANTEKKVWMLTATLS